MTEINLTIKEFCEVVEGESSLDPSFLVCNLASLERATERDVAVIFDPENNSVFDPLSPERIKKSKAGVFLASKNWGIDSSYVLVKDPLHALEQLQKFLKTRKQKKGAYIHQSAVVSEWAIVEDEVTIGAHAVVSDDAKIGYGAIIGDHVVIGQGCEIGCHTLIHAGAKVLDRCLIGDGSIIHAGAVIGSDGFGYRVMKTGLHKIPHLGIVRIGKQVEIGANTTIDRAEFDETVIGDGVKLDNQVHIAHNVKIGQCTAILAHTGIAGSTVIGAGCQIGGQVAIKDHVTIGSNVKIVSKSAVMRDLADGEVVCGIPSMPFSQWKRLMVAMMKLPELHKSFKRMNAYFEKKRNSFWGRFFKRGT